MKQARPNFITSAAIGNYIKDLRLARRVAFMENVGHTGI
jgi:hypothetical protein